MVNSWNLETAMSNFYTTKSSALLFKYDIVLCKTNHETTVNDGFLARVNVPGALTGIHRENMSTSQLIWL